MECEFVPHSAPSLCAENRFGIKASGVCKTIFFFVFLLSNLSYIMLFALSRTCICMRVVRLGFVCDTQSMKPSPLLQGTSDPEINISDAHSYIGMELSCEMVQTRANRLHTTFVHMLLSVLAEENHVINTIRSQNANSWSIGVYMIRRHSAFFCSLVTFCRRAPRRVSLQRVLAPVR